MQLFNPIHSDAGILAWDSNSPRSLIHIHESVGTCISKFYEIDKPCDVSHMGRGACRGDTPS